MLSTFGWDAGFAAALATLSRPDLQPARVVAVDRGRVVLHDERAATLAGALRHAGAEPAVVGDWVAVSPEGVVQAVLPRRTQLRRRGEALVANADTAILVTSLNHDLNERRLERFLAIARDGGAEPLVVLSKGDLSADPPADTRRVEAIAGGAPVLALSALHGWGVNALRAAIVPGTTAAMLGTSGVGKSTLVNLLLGEEVQRTLPVREGDDRGRHATTRRELFALPGGGLLIDTPGVRRPALDGGAGLEATFDDIAALAERCRFTDCRHDSEPGCAVREAVAPQRLASLRKLEREAWTAQERKARGRAGQRAYRQAKRLKNRP